MGQRVNRVDIASACLWADVPVNFFTLAHPYQAHGVTSETRAP
jgi:hypothetical protein